MALARYRMEKGWGLNELARLAELDPAQLSRLEGGHQVTARAPTLRKLAKVLEVEIDHLMRLAQISRSHPLTTASIGEVVDEVGLPGIPTELEVAIQRDSSIPGGSKKWLLECVARARDSTS